MKRTLLLSFAIILTTGACLFAQEGKRESNILRLKELRSPITDTLNAKLHAAQQRAASCQKNASARWALQRVLDLRLSRSSEQDQWELEALTEGLENIGCTSLFPEFQRLILSTLK